MAIATMSPQETQQQQAKGLFSGKVHFRLPSAEGTFAFPHEDHIDTESVASAVVKQSEQSKP